MAGSPGPAATLVNGGEVAGDSPIFGRKLPEFWQMVDLILERVLPRPHPVIKGFTSPGPRRPDTNSLITGRTGAGPGGAGERQVTAGLRRSIRVTSRQVP